MGNYEQLKQSVSNVIKTNGNQEITGSILQNVLLTIISTVGANATFAGVATPTTNPGTPDGHVFYLASESGTYTNFNAIELQDGLSVLMWNGSWSSQQMFGVDDVPTAGSDNPVKSGGVFPTINAVNKALIPINGKVSIIGDSISTYEGTVPSGYPTYYPQPSSGVTSLYDMWWHLLLSMTDSKLEVNVSCGGSKATSRDGYPDFYDRTNVLGSPDYIFVELGTNDSSNDVALGNYDYDSENLSESEFIPAYIKGVKALKTNYPNAKIVLFVFQMDDSYASAIKNIGKHYELDVIDVRSYYIDNVHPNKLQMCSVAQTICSFYIRGKCDDEPTAGSDNLVKSGGVYTKIKALKNTVLGIGDVKEDTGIYTEILQEPSTSWVKKRICKINSRETYKLSIYGDATTSMSSVATANLVDTNGNVIEYLKIYNTISQEPDDLLFTSTYEGFLEIWTRIEDGSLYVTAKNAKILLERVEIAEKKINDLKYKTLGASDATIVDYGWINYDDGTLKDNVVESYDRVYEYINRNYIKISLITAVYSDANALVAFYSTPTISSDGYLKSVSVQSNGTQKLESVEMDIPSDCKLIVVTNQARLGDVSIKIMSDTIEDIDLHLESIDEDIDKLSNRKYNSVMYEGASMPPFEFLNESMIEKHGVVIGKDSTIDTVLAESPCIWYDTSLQKLIMIYTSYSFTDRVMVSTHHYALSNDGINWEKKGEFFRGSGVDGTPDSKGTTGPVMVLWNSKYYLFYIGLTSTGYEGGDKTLCLAVGNSIDDFINDTAERRGTIIGVGYGWANLQIWHPSFINVDNKWYCFINATGTVNGVVKERIGYYISDKLDGEWTQSSEHLLQYIDESTRGRQVAIDPSVMLYGDYYIMMYGTLITDNNGGYKGYDHWAYTTKEDFPIGWKYGGIAASPSENYDKKYACKPWLMKFKGKIYHYYTAVNESDVRGIALNY